jgi:polygalacturonase
MRKTLVCLLVALLLLCGVQVAWAGEQKRVNVLTAGLVGDGATDNTAALRAAIAANGSFTTYYFPPGTYTYCISRRNLRGGIHLRVRWW